ncbi:hypothetical protein [Psychrobacter pygoscelis]|uniref:hypothetical protein n=1 Tax=Psychrobacter pygoscelis TaxID=2488563 RepID=UPI00103914F7|nr:hypothetical protein [Psychrobacter pygoscelis]
MPLRPVDAIFVHPERRCYVIYHGGELWQLTRMKLDVASWWRRQAYRGDPNALFLSHNQYIEDTELARKLRTLDLPKNLHGTSFPKFKDWWLTHGFDWLKDIITKGESPLAGHAKSSEDKDTPAPAIDTTPTNKTTDSPLTGQLESRAKQSTQPSSGNIFDDMLAELADEVLHSR